MTAKSDPFSKADTPGEEISIRAGIEESAVALKAKSRAVTALDRLVGAAVDIPGVWLQRRAERARIIAITEQEAMKIDASSFLEARREASKIVDAKSAWIEDARRFIDNKAAVASYAVEELKLIDHVAGDEADQCEDSEYSFEDWLNAFAHRAEMATSEEMRSILGRILAGEVLKPLSFSVATLRIVAELDSRIAKRFQDLCLQRFQERHIVKFQEDMQGPRSYDLYDLEERGLIKEVGGQIQHILNRHSDGFYYYGEKSKVLKMSIEPVNEYFPVSTVVHIMILTTSGLQLARLLPYDEEAGLKAIATSLTKHEAVKCIELHRIDGSGLSLIDTLLKQRA